MQAIASFFDSHDAMSREGSEGESSMAEPERWNESDSEGYVTPPTSPAQFHRPAPGTPPPLGHPSHPPLPTPPIDGPEQNTDRFSDGYSTPTHSPDQPSPPTSPPSSPPTPSQAFGPPPLADCPLASTPPSQTSDPPSQTSDPPPQASDPLPQVSAPPSQTSDLPPQASDPSSQASDPPPQTSDSPMTRVLTASDLPALMRVLGNAAHYTNHLGTQLGLDLNLVQTLSQKAMGDPVQHLSLVLDKRLRNTAHPLSLQVLLNTISRPPLDDEDLAWRLEESFMGEQPLARTGDLPLSPEMATFVNYLDARYKKMSVDSKGGPALRTPYINLAVIKKETVSRAEADKFTKATLHGGIDEIMRKKEAIELKDILKPEGNQSEVSLVLVEGAPGVGKSTLALELCRKRREIEMMKAFSLVVLLALREKEVQEAKSLADLICHDNPRIKQAVVDEIILSGGEGTLLVLDGFDEVPARLRKSSFLAQVICGIPLPKATILVTSRPSARADLLSFCDPHKHIEVLVFTDELICQHARSVFGSDSSTLDDFLKYISANPSIKSMMYVPLNCAIVVEIYQENREAGKLIPQTMTQLYSEVTLTRVWRHLETKGDQSVQTLPEKLEDLREENHEIHGQLLGLAKVAFEGTLKQQVIFERLPAGCSTLGLMTESQQHRKLTRYNFFHLTMQEFLSAFYVSELPRSEQKAVFERYSVESSDEDEENFSHMDVVWRFVAGLTGFNDIGWDLVQSRRGDEEAKVSPFLVQCLYEAQEKVDCDPLLGRSKVIYEPVTASALDCFAVGYCVAVTKCTWEVDLRGCGLGPELVEMLVHGLTSQGEVRGSIGVLILFRNPIGQEGVAHLRKIPCKVLQHLHHLDVSDCELPGAAVDTFSDIVPTMTSLKHLNIEWTSTKSGVAKKVFQSLGTTHLHTLIITPDDGITLSNNDLETLPHLIRPSGNLKEVIMHVTIATNTVELLKITLSPSSLEHLALVLSTPVPSVPSTGNHNLKTLQIVTFHPMHSSDIAALIHGNTALETLSIGRVRSPHLTFYYSRAITRDPAQTTCPLSDAVKVNQSLKTLTLNVDTSDKVTREVVHDVVGALQYNQTLERLYLDYKYWKFVSDKELDPRVIKFLCQPSNPL